MIQSLVFYNLDPWYLKKIFTFVLRNHSFEKMNKLNMIWTSEIQGVSIDHYQFRNSQDSQKNAWKGKLVAI